MKKAPESVISSEIIHHGRLVDFRIDRVRLASGREARRELFIHPGSAAIVARTATDEVLLVAQYRHALKRTIFEIPAGTLEPGEAPEACAYRELEEETGYRAGSLRKLLTLFPSPGVSSEIMHIFEARELTAGNQALDEDEALQLKRVKFSRALEMVRAGEIVDGKTVAALLYVSTF